MPELPEVETIARRLRPKVVGKKIANVQVLRNKSFQGDLDVLLRLNIVDISRRSKILQLKLSSGNYLAIHLKMTGQLLYRENGGSAIVGGGHPTADWLSQLPGRHTRVIVTFSDSSQLFFNDMRVFGWIRHMTPQELAQEFIHTAPDIIDESVDYQYFQTRLACTNRAIKQVIMDNAMVAGVGNIYACDALHLAKIHPQRISASLTEAEVQALLDSMKTVINLGIEHEGATIAHFKHSDGFGGGYQHIRRVYAREGEPCMVCRTPISKIKLGGRGTYFCEGCQVLNN